MRFLNGLKTIVGGLGIVATVLSKTEVLVLLPLAWQPYVLGGSVVLTTLGIIHKAEKRHDAQTS